MPQDAKRILIVCQLDGFGNSERPTAMERFLRNHGHVVTLCDTYRLSRSRARHRFAHRLPGRGPKRLALYATEAAAGLLNRHGDTSRRILSYYLVLAEYHLRRDILRLELCLDEFDLIACETPYDAGVLTLPTSARKLYDCPTPWADELFFEDRLTRRQHRKLREFERRLFESVDFLSFHWESYARYALRTYRISGQNICQVNSGCEPASRRAEFRSPARIAYLGSLGARFIDLPLLARLTKLYPYIDVFGAPAPDPALGLNYLGYAQPTVLQRYQLGLITCTRDELRRSGFSAKHLTYLSRGLPVLVPAWRRDLDLLEGSVPYEEETFVPVVQSLSDETEWMRRSDEAYAQARRLAWEQTLRPLLDVLDATAPQASAHAVGSCRASDSTDRSSPTTSPMDR